MGRIVRQDPYQSPHELSTMGFRGPLRPLPSDDRWREILGWSRFKKLHDFFLSRAMQPIHARRVVATIYSSLPDPERWERKSAWAAAADCFRAGNMHDDLIQHADEDWSLDVERGTDMFVPGARREGHYNP